MRPGIYRHFKGGVYEVLMTGWHTEAEEVCVIYRDIEIKEIQIRPLDMFAETVEVDGKSVPRFERIRD
ncbi:DUF1653 domain-containing protein [Amycolatopsis sp. NPDC051716]|uniref:DUF1653 domain-containing protein n=1 Tax=Amycolatopsis sp. NPDC051716 TaxID=3155804 RepID=UPI00343E777F